MLSSCSCARPACRFVVVFLCVKDVLLESSFTEFIQCSVLDCTLSDQQACICLCRLLFCLWMCCCVTYICSLREWVHVRVCACSFAVCVGVRLGVVAVFIEWHWCMEARSAQPLTEWSRWQWLRLSFRTAYCAHKCSCVEQNAWKLVCKLTGTTARHINRKDWMLDCIPYHHLTLLLPALDHMWGL